MDEFESALREQRVKKGVDYAYTYKYGKLHILCDEVWVDLIREAAELLGIVVGSWHTY